MGCGKTPDIEFDVFHHVDCEVTSSLLAMPVPLNQIRIALAVILGMVCLRTRATAADLEFFEKNVRPVLVERCFKCHSSQAEKLKGGLFLDSREGLLKGGDEGPAVVPGVPEKSRLVEAISYGNVDFQMPPKGKLPEEQIKALTAWVKMGAPWPLTEKSESKALVSSFDLRKRKSEHWAWQPLRKEVPSLSAGDSWSKNAIDRFILAKLQSAGLSPAAAAEKRVLIRRATFDLTGLPPTIPELNAFMADASPEAFEKVVDRLLDSPQFGERWGRHWLDLVRYAETMGHEFDYPIPFAWRYRDYVIRAFNLDLPYKKFVTEHIAGDLIVPPRTDPATGLNESILGTSFFWLSQQSHSPVDIKAAQATLIENQIDVLGKAFLGMTVACARCHDHKFDAISSKDYYALYGVLESSHFTFAPIDSPASLRRAIEPLISLKRDLKEQIAGAWLDQAAHLTNVTIPLRMIAAADPEKGVVLFSDFSAGKSDEWFRTGEAFERIGPGELILTSRSNQPVRLSERAALRSDSLSRRLQGAARSPTFTIDHDYIHIYAGGGNSRINLVIDNFNLIRSPIYGGLKAALTESKAKWITFEVKTWKGHRACIELSDFALSDPADERSYGPDGYLFAEKVYFSDEKDLPETKKGTTDPKSESEPISGAELREAIERWGKNAFSEQDAEMLAGLLAENILKLPDTEEFQKTVAEYAAAEKVVPEPSLASVMAEGNGADENLFIRGNPKSLGEKVERRFLEACGTGASFKQGSGRMELAEALTDPANPLPSRVAANWAWHHLFGRGLVASVDNFGVLGERPSHSELLDWLALRFQEEGGSFKKLIREIMLSATYQMSSTSRDKLIEEKDPDNRLLHKARVRRLEAEAIRDSMLAISASLNLSQFGPPVPVYLTAFMDGRGKPGNSGPLDGAGRRTIYLEVRRNFLNPMMLAFDYPMPASTVGRRSESNVPAQALTLLNDPFIINQAENWAKSSFKKYPDLKPEERIRNFYLAAFARPPESNETADAVAFLAGQERLNGSGEPAEKSWTDLCHVLFNVKEFIFLN